MTSFSPASVGRRKLLVCLYRLCGSVANNLKSDVRRLMSDIGCLISGPVANKKFFTSDFRGDLSDIGKTKELFKH